jgi:hypothetical protein
MSPASVTSVTAPPQYMPDALGVGQAPGEYPVECLPPVVRDLSLAVSTSLGVPACLPSSCALAAVSACLGKGLEVQSSAGRRTRGNLFFFASAPSGLGKSETHRVVMRPLLDLQRREIDVWERELRPRALAAKEFIGVQLASIKTSIKGIDPSSLREVGEQMAKLVVMKEECEAALVEPSVICEDVTSERLAVLLVDNNETLFSASPDAGAPLANLLGRYRRGGGTDESLFLRAFSGDPVHVDRVSRRGVKLDSPCLSLLWLMQPARLDELYDQRSLADDGLLARVLPCRSTDNVSFSGESPGSAIPTEVARRWEDVINGLFGEFHHPANSPVVLVPSLEATAVLAAYGEQVSRLRQQNPGVEVFAARWLELAWRLGVVLHAGTYGAASPEHPLGGDTARAAVQLIAWHVAEQLALLDTARDERQMGLEDRVIRLLQSLRGRPWPRNSVCARDLHRRRIVKLGTEAHRLLARMEADGLLCGTDQRPARGGHTVRYYREAV